MEHPSSMSSWRSIVVPWPILMVNGSFPKVHQIDTLSFLVVFASGRDLSLPSQDETGHWHTDFQLAREDETLSLNSPSGEVLSSINTVPKQRADVSYGLASDSSLAHPQAPGTSSSAKSTTTQLPPATKNEQRGSYCALISSSSS